jgi:hypothetical protein
MKYNELGCEFSREIILFRNWGSKSSSFRIEQIIVISGKWSMLGSDGSFLEVERKTIPQKKK